MIAKLWIDVEDLFEYARGNPRPSGIQRLAFEIYKALQERPDAGEFVRFVRHDTPRNSFQVVPWSDIIALFAGLTESVPEITTPLPEPIAPHPPSRQAVRRLVHRLPPLLRAHVIDALLTQQTAFRAWVRLFDALARGITIRLVRPFRRLRLPPRRLHLLLWRPLCRPRPNPFTWMSSSKTRPPATYCWCWARRGRIPTMPGWSMRNDSAGSDSLCWSMT